MLISRVPEDNGGKGEGRAIGEDIAEETTQNYQTANELFEIMSKEHDFDSIEEDQLSSSDIVLLYKNIDLGKQLMSNAKGLKRKLPNQYVETVVYKEDPESDNSDASDVYSNEELHNMMLINKERIDLLKHCPSFNNTLCHKLGDLEMHTSNLTSAYEKQFLFKDPFLHQQLKSLNAMSKEFEGMVLPVSLLDYVCCKRLEDNYNFYMENIIRYVKHTIEQLKRISNGDYLTDKAKEKWREVENDFRNDGPNSKVLTTSTSIPLHVERKLTGFSSTWDDIVHSEMDVRSLAKILEKKIVVEVPKLICGSYRLFSKYRDDNLIISCKRSKEPLILEEKESRVDVVVKLQRSQSGKIMSNIDSIMVFEKKCVSPQNDSPVNILPLPYKNDTKAIADTARIVELTDDAPGDDLESTNKSCSRPDMNNGYELEADDGSSTNDYPSSDNEYKSIAQTNRTFQNETDYSITTVDINKLQSPVSHIVRAEASFNLVSPEELQFTMQNLNRPQESVGDSLISSNKRKSPTRIRIKSPYENKSHLMEEKKRKKLLEMREKRQMRKMANENNRVTKHKYGKNVQAQASSSVTKLSITNKAFYNSIYGQNGNFGKESSNKIKNRKEQIKKDSIPEIDIEKFEEEYVDTRSIVITPEEKGKKYINRTYYLDDAVTELQMKQIDNSDGPKNSPSTSAISNSSGVNLLSQFMSRSLDNLEDNDLSSSLATGTPITNKITQRSEAVGIQNEELDRIQCALNMVPTNTPKNASSHEKAKPAIECRRSIEKIYMLMKKLDNIETDTKTSKSKVISRKPDKIVSVDPCSSDIQISDSGTSVKHHLTSSDPSCFSFDKHMSKEDRNSKDCKKNVNRTPAAVVPKVIISTKFQSNVEGEKIKKDRKKLSFSPRSKPIPENPLKAISQLLHEFDNVQKTRQKTTEHKPIKCAVVGKNISSQDLVKKRPRADHNNMSKEPERNSKPLTPRERRLRYVPTPVSEILKTQHDPEKQKIADIIDEVKEARGEAVRGPSKLSSRLNSLAQPKKAYVPVHSEGLQSRYGRSMVTERVQRGAAAAASAAQPSRSRPRRIGPEAPSSVTVKSSFPHPLERGGKMRRSPGISPNRRRPPSPELPARPVLDTAPALKKKMVAVESYIKNHYGRLRARSAELHGYKAHVPLLPHDLDFSSMGSSPSPSAEESTAIGSRLHRIVECMMHPTLPTIDSLERATGLTEPPPHSDIDENSKLCTPSCINVPCSTSSDYPVDIFGEKNLVTAVEFVLDDANQDYPDNKKTEETAIDLQAFSSTTELKRLENALYRKMSVGAFPKRLRIKNLTLTPKHSMQQVLLLQSGDAASLVLKTKSSRSLTITTSEIHQGSHFKNKSVLTKPSLNWSFAEFPMQISTVGYGFPIVQSVQCNLLKKETNEDLHKSGCGNDIDKESSDCKSALINISKPNILIEEKGQVLEDSQAIHRPEQAAQADFTDFNVSYNNNEIPLKNINKKQDVKVEKNCESTRMNHNSETPHCDMVTLYTKKSTHEEDSINMTVENNTDTLDYTTSLDILVSLLNEIQKITTCQTNMTNINDHGCMDTKIMLNDSAAQDNRQPTGIKDTRLPTYDKSAKTKNNNSKVSSCVFNEDQCAKDMVEEKIENTVIGTNSVSAEASAAKPICADEEVNVEFPEKELINVFTAVPSHLQIVSVNNYTYVTNSLMGILTEPSSTESTSNYSDYETLSPIDSQNKIMELPESTISIRDVDKALVVYQNIKRSADEAELEKVVTKSVDVEIENDTYKDSVLKTRTVINKYYSSNYDPVLKIKWDILVTVYSVLVLTIFAALSFPDLVVR